MERRVLGLGCAVVVLCASKAVHAQMDYRLTVGVAGLASDNPGSRSAEATNKVDAATVIRGGVDVGYLGRFATERLSYGITATKWAGDTRNSSLSHMLRLSSDVEATPATRISLSAGATLAQLGLLDTVSAASLPTTGPQPTSPQPTSSQQVGPQPVGDQKILTLNARESISWQPNGQWRVNQGLTGTAFRRLGSGVGATDNKALTAEFGVAKQWSQDSAGMRGRVGVMMTSVSQTTAGSRFNELAESSLVWGHQWNAEVSQELSAGLLVVRSDQARFMPTAAAGLTWQRPEGMLSGRLARTADYSVMVGSALQRSVATLSIALPINRLETLRLMGSANLERATSMGTQAGSGRSINAFSAQAGLGWQPGNTFAYSLAYTFRDQWAVSDASDSPSIFVSFRRQTIMLTVGAGFAGIL